MTRDWYELPASEPRRSGTDGCHANFHSIPAIARVSGFGARGSPRRELEAQLVLSPAALFSSRARSLSEDPARTARTLSRCISARVPIGRRRYVYFGRRRSRTKWSGRRLRSRRSAPRFARTSSSRGVELARVHSVTRLQHSPSEFRGTSTLSRSAGSC